jgi:hypothetical protein
MRSDREAEDPFGQPLEHSVLGLRPTAEQMLSVSR